MGKPPPEIASRLLVDCLGVVINSPEAWRTFEHEQEEKPDGSGDSESFDDWALRKAGILAKRIWERSQP